MDGLMLVQTLFGLEEIEENKQCIKCLEVKPFAEFQARSYNRQGNPSEIRNDCKKCQRKESKVVQKLKKYHSVPSEDKECIGCGEKEKDKRMRINPRRKTLWTADHDHKTGKFRGYLCDYCNTILARANDDSETLIRLAKYLEKHKKCMN